MIGERDWAWKSEGERGERERDWWWVLVGERERKAKAASQIKI